MTNSQSDVRDESSVISDSSLRTQNSQSSKVNDKRQLISSLHTKIRQNISDAVNSPAYYGRINQLIKNLTFTLKDLKDMEAKGQDIVYDDAAFYGLEDVDLVPDDVAPLCTAPFEKGLRVGTKEVPTLRLRPLVLDGSKNATFKGLFYVKKTNYQNEHEECSHLKRYVDALIVDNNLNTMNLIGLKHYNNKTNGPSVIVAPLCMHVLLNKFPAIQETKLPVLAIVHDFKPGLHIGSQMSYFCDRDGDVVGVHKGSNYFWRDHTCPFKASGNFGSYKYETLMTYGDQRIVYLQPGLTPFEVPYVPRLVPTWASVEQKGKSIRRNGPVLGPAPEPALTLGVCDMIPKEKNGRSIVVPTSTNYPLLGTPPWYARLGRCINKTHCFTALSATCIVLSNRCPNPHIKRWLRICAGASFGVSAACITGEQLFKHEIKVTYNLEPLYFKGKHAEGLKCFYAENPIDTETGHPYGNYYVNRWTVSQVSQKGLCNYTNVHKLVEKYTTSIGAPKTAAPGIYLDAFPTSAPNIVQPSDNTFHIAKISPLPRVTSATKYRVYLKPGTPEMGVHLLNPEKFRQFIASAITEDTIAATASNRVVCETIKPKLTRQEFYTRYCEFWRSHNLPFSFYIDAIPNLNYTGAKLKRYLAVLKYYGIRKVVCAYDTFLKREALPLASFLKKAVRLICPNNSLFLVATKNFFSKSEELLLTAEGPIGVKLFAKHRKIHERWEDILTLRDHYRYCIPGDAKNFDATHRNAGYLAEIDFWETLGLEHEYAESMRTAKTFGAIQHDVPMRHSGDLCTGSGNCLTIAACSSTLPEGITIYCDGDDTLFFSNDPDVRPIIEDHFKESGFVMELENPIDLQSDGWEVEFCHVFYTEQGYSYDCTRLLNRFGNIVGSTYEQLAKTILGKVQALPILEAAGCDFGFSVRELVRGDPENSRDKYTMSQFEGMQNYLPTRSVDLNLNDPANGFIAQVLLMMRSKQYYLRLLSDKRWKSVVLKSIVKLLKQQAEKQCFDISIMQRAEELMKEFGLRSISPTLASIIRANAIDVYNLDVVTYRCSDLPRINANPYLQQVAIRKPLDTDKWDVDYYWYAGL